MTKADPYEVNLPVAPGVGSSGGAGGKDINWFELFGDSLGGLGNLFGSQDSATSARSIRPPSADEMTIQGYTLDQLFNRGPNPTYAYGIGGQADMLEGGMQASPQQLAYLDQIRRNQIDTGTRGVNDWLDTARRGNLNSSLARGMDQSSVELWGQDQSTKEAMRSIADLIGGANTQYAQGATALPYQTAGVYQNVATLGQNEGNQSMTQLIDMLRTMQAPRMEEVSQTSTTQLGTASRTGAAGDLISTLGNVPWDKVFA